MNNKKSINIVSQSDFIWLLNSVLKNWFIFLIVVPLFTIFGFLYNHKQKDFYRTKIEILLKSNDVYDYQENIQSSLGVYNYYGDISNQQRIIGSYDMIQKVLKKLDLSCSYFIVGRLNTKEFYKELPFQLKADVLNYKLYEVPIDFYIIDTNKYRLNYSINEVEYENIHYFDSVEATNHYSINASLNTFVDFKRFNNYENV